MIFKTEDGRSVEMEVYGHYEDVEIDEAYYLDSEEDVTQEDIEYILDTYAAEIQEILMERHQMSFDFENADY